jgi:hypothetical protein
MAKPKTTIRTKSDKSMGVWTRTRYTVECIKPDGSLRWRESFYNIVVDEGLNTLLDNTFTAPPADVAWYVGLKGTGAVSASDVMASHGAWNEINPYAGDRATYTPNGAASGGAISNSGAKAVFTINTGATVFGAFMTSDPNGNAGLLYGAGDFASPRAVLAADSLRVQIDPSVA